MKTVKLIIIMCIATLTLHAQKRSEGEMERIASLQLQRVNINAKPKLLMAKDMLHVYGCSNGGFVVVGNNRNSKAVLAYSDGKFDAEKMPDGLRWWLNATEQCMERGAMPEYAQKPSEAVSPMLKSQWGQQSPFNNLCPKVGMWGNSGYTGCVATAMAQILRYHRYPAQSTGKSYYLVGDSQKKNTVSLSTSFDWDNMLNAYTWNYNDASANAVAELMRDCGYASHMRYMEQGSGTTGYDAGYGLIHNMCVDSLSIRVMHRNYTAEEEWINTIYDELLSGRPILYNATDPERLGHAFVIDGMDADGKVHVNWGWTGDADGFFDISALNPSYLNPYTASTETYHFTDDQIMVVGIVPRKDPLQGEKYMSNFYIQGERDSMWVDNDSIKLKSVPVFNYSALDFNGILGIVVQDEKGHGVILPFFYSKWSNNETVPVLGGLYTTDTYFPEGTLNESDGKTPRPDGKYFIYLVSWSKEEMNEDSDPQFIRFPMALADKFGHNYSIWEIEKKNGHWVEGSMKRTEALTDYLPSLRSETRNNVPTSVYDCMGRMIYSGGNINNVDNLNKTINVKSPGLVIVSENGKTRKVFIK